MKVDFYGKIAFLVASSEYRLVSSSEYQVSRLLHEIATFLV